MAYARVTKSGRWQGCARSTTGRIISRVFDNRQAALDWAESTQQLIKGGFDPGLAKTLLVKVARIRANTLEPGNAHNTAKALTVKLVDTPLGSTAICDVIPGQITDWLADFNLSWRSCKRYKEELGSVFKWAELHGYWPANRVYPTRYTVLPPKPPPAPATGVDPLNLENLTRIVKAVRARNSLCADVVQFLGLVGLRWGELRALQVGDIRLVDGQLMAYINHNQPEGERLGWPKNGRARWVPIASSLSEIVEKHSAGKKASDLLFTGANGGQLWRSRFMRQSGYKAISDGLTLHDLRHLAGCVWIDAGMKLPTVSQLLGHSDVQITAKIYLQRRGRINDPQALAILNSLGGCK